MLQAYNLNEQFAGARQVNIDVMDDPLPYYTEQATLAERQVSYNDIHTGCTRIRVLTIS